jgi:hypothetical protein
MIATHTPSLFYFQCSQCKTVATSPVFSPRYECVACRRWLKFLYRTPVHTPEQRELHARGVVYNPHRVAPQPWTCVRCGTECRDLRPTYRVDGKCCRDCVQAEVPPDRIELASVERAREDQERLEAAYRAAEGE